MTEWARLIEVSKKWKSKYLMKYVACDVCQSNNHFIRNEGYSLLSNCDICGVKYFHFLELDELPETYKDTYFDEWCEELYRAYIKDELRNS